MVLGFDTALSTHAFKGVFTGLTSIRKHHDVLKAFFLEEPPFRFYVDLQGVPC